MLRELTGFTARTLTITLKAHDDWRRFLGTGKEQTSLLSSRMVRTLGNCNLVSLCSIIVKVMKQIFLENISRHVKDQKLIRSGQYDFMKGKCGLTF